MVESVNSEKTASLNEIKVPHKLFGNNNEDSLITPSLLKKFWKFMKLFGSIYITCTLMGYYVFHHTNRDYYFSITYITTLLSILTFFWDSEALRGVIWAIIPGFWIFWFYWFIPWLISLPNPDPQITFKLFVSHLPMFTLFIYFMVLLKKGYATRWWIVLLATIFWVTYLTIFRLIDNAIPKEEFNFYHGWFPYIWPLIIYLVIASGTISTLLLYYLERKGVIPDKPLVNPQIKTEKILEKVKKSESAFKFKLLKKK